MSKLVESWESMLNEWREALNTDAGRSQEYHIRGDEMCRILDYIEYLKEQLAAMVVDVSQSTPSEEPSRE